MTIHLPRIRGFLEQAPSQNGKSAPEAVPGQSSPLTQQLINESHVMAYFALTSGQEVPASVIQAIDSFSLNDSCSNSPQQLKQLVKAHKELLQIVSPAKPKTLVLLVGRERPSGLRGVLGPVPVVWQMTIIALVFMVIFIGLSAFQMDNSPANNTLNVQTVKLLELLYFMAAAGLGAAFAALYKANRYIVSGCFDQDYAFSYWIRFTLGLMAGLLLAMLIPMNNLETAGLTPILLALLGGFSSDVLYRILTRLIETLESIVRGSYKKEDSGD